MIAAVRRRPLAQEDTGTVDRENPWPGLAAFREEDREFFHGRAAAVEELHRRVCRERLTVLYGLSGLGKSSLLGAGLFPRLRQNGFLPVLVRLDYAAGAAEPADQVREALLREAAESGVEMPPWCAGDSLWEYLHRPALELWSSRNRLVTPVLVFDQFEEIFTLGRSRPDLAVPRRRFLDELGDLVEGRPPARVRERLESEPEKASEYDFHRHPYKVLLALREDFLADLEELRRRMPSLAHNRMRLQRMTGEDALSVVLGAGGHLVEPGVAEQIVRFVAASRTTADRALAELTVEPALLSVVCRELNLRRRQRGEERITADLLKGDRDEILGDFYERGVADLPPEGRRFLEDRLLTASGFRDSIAVEDALEADGLDREALDRLVAGRLVRREERSGVPRVELTHDVLTGVVRASRDRRREREAREAAAAAKRVAEEREEIAAAKLRRSRVTSAVLAASLLLAVVAGIVALVANRNARQAQVHSSYEAASRLATSDEGSKAKSLALLASVLRLEPDHRPARHLMHDLLLRSSWPLPVQVLRHDDGVVGAGPSEDGRVVVSITRLGTVRIWDVGTGKTRGPPLRHRDRIVTAAVSHDGTRVVTADTSGEARLWSAEDGAAYGVPMHHRREVVGANFLPGDRRVVTVSRDGTARLWDAESGRPAGGPLEHGEGLLWLAIGERSDRLLTGSTDGVVKVWSSGTGHPVFDEPIRHDGEILWSVDLTEDGSRALTVTNQGVYLWDAATGRLEESLLSRLPYWVTRGRFSPDGGRIAFSNPEGIAFLWDLEEGARTGSFLAHGVDVTSLRFSHDGEYLLTISADDSANLWHVGTGERLGQPLRHGGKVFSAVLVPRDPMTVVTASADGTARVWDLRRARGDGFLFHRGHDTRYSVLSPDGRYVLVRSARGGTLFERGYEVSTGAPLGPPIVLDGVPALTMLGPGGAHALHLSDGACVIASTRDGFRVCQPLRHDDGPIDGVRISGDGRLVATKSKGGSVRVWEVETGRRIGMLPPEPAKIVAVDLDPSGTRMAVGHEDGTLRLWRVPSFEMAARQPRGHDLPVNVVRFLSDRHLLGGAADGEIWVDDLSTARRSSQLMRHDLRVLDADMSPDGTRLVTASFDGTVRVWSLPEGEPVGEAIQLGVWVASARLSPDGETVLTLDMRTRARRWATETGEPLGLPSGDGVTDARFVGDGGGWVSTGWGKEGTVLWDSPDAWDADPERLADLAEAISGFSVDEEGVVRPLRDPAERLRSLRRRAERRDLPFVRWFVADPWERTLTPSSEITVEEYVRGRLSALEESLQDLPPDRREDFRASVRSELDLAFPGYPLLAEP